jgi:hypothetical protein
MEKTAPEVVELSPSFWMAAHTTQTVPIIPLRCGRETNPQFFEEFPGRQRRS